MGPVPHLYRSQLGEWFTTAPIFVADGHELFTIQEHGAQPVIRFYDTTTGEVRASTKDHAFASLHSASLSPDGHTMVIGGALYDAKSHKVLQNIDNNLGEAFSPTRELIAETNEG